MHLDPIWPSHTDWHRELLSGNLRTATFALCNDGQHSPGAKSSEREEVLDVAVPRELGGTHEREAGSGDVGDLVELSRVLVSVAYRSLRVAGAELTLPQFRALAVVARQGSISAGRLAAELDMHASTLTRLCDRLLRGDWITRQTNPENRREVRVALTVQGARTVDRVLEARASEIRNVLDRMPQASRSSLRSVLPHLLQAAADLGLSRKVDWAV